MPVCVPVMNETQLSPLEAILRYCAAAAPHPWYPSEHARKNGIDRESLDPHLDQLRMGGLIRLTDWVQDFGQGYALTEAGREILERPQKLSRLQSGELAGARAERASGAGALTTWDRGEIVRSAIFERNRPVVMQFLLAANIAVFLAGLWLVQTQHLKEEEALHRTGALFAHDLVRGDWWRLLTCCFVHAKWWHIGMNMYALYIAGQVAEAMWGRVRFLVLYLIAGFGGSCVAMAYYSFGLVGASGALCGILAAEGVWIFLNRRHLDRRIVRSWLQNLLINAVLIGIIGVAIPGVSNAAHLGGAVIGAIAGLFFNTERFARGWIRWPSLAGVVLLPLLSLGVLHYGMTTNGEWLVREYLPPIETAQSSADRAVTSANKLFVIEPADRQPEAVRKAVTELAAARERLQGHATQLSHLGPYRDAAYEEARQVRQEQLRELIRLLELCEQRLQRGSDWTDADEAKLKDQAERQLKARREWQDLLN